MSLSPIRLMAIASVLPLAIASAGALAQSTGDSDAIARQAKNSAQQSNRSLKYNQARQQQFMDQRAARQGSSTSSSLQQKQLNQQAQRSAQQTQQARQQMARPSQSSRTNQTRSSGSAAR